MQKKFINTLKSRIHFIGIGVLTIVLILANVDVKAQNYGIRDDDGVNLPTVTYWYSGQSADLTERGSQFNSKELGDISQLYFKGVSIKTWKSGSGDVTGAQFNYKVWKTNDSEPVDYIEKNVDWSSNDGDGNQTWANFGDEIEITQGLSSGNYNLKILFTITGTGIAGTTQDGPFQASFQISNEPTITFANLTWPNSVNVTQGTDVDIYAQVTVTNQSVGDDGIDGLTVWVGISDENNNPSSWIQWYEANWSGLGEFTNNPEYMLTLPTSDLDEGIYYFATRFQLNGDDFVYGGYSSSGGGFWDGVTNISGVLTISESIIAYPVIFTVQNNNDLVSQIKIKGSFNAWTAIDMENESANIWTKEFTIEPGTYEWGLTDQEDNWLIEGSDLIFTLDTEGNTTGQIEYEIPEPIAQYGIRDDDGVNLPTVTYWYSGQSADLTERGSQFNSKELGDISQLYFKGVSIKTWKSGAGDVTGAQFNYKVWKTNDSEPVDYIVKNVDWSSNDGDGNQTWANFGDEIEITQGLSSGNYNLKILFTITGTGIAGTTQDGPFTASFTILEQSGEAEILAFEIENQVGETEINSYEANVVIRMYEGTNVTALIPNITISDGATISPQSGIAQDFTNHVTYTVTAENGSIKEWYVTVLFVEMPIYKSVTFNVDMTPALNQGIFNPETDFVDIGANFNAWIGSEHMVLSTGNIYTLTTGLLFEVGEELLFKFRINGDWNTSELYGEDNRSYYVVDDENIYNAVYDHLGDSQANILFANLQYPGAATIEIGQTVDVYSQIEIANCELLPDYGYQGLLVFVGLSETNTNPETWDNWTEAIYVNNPDITRRPEYKAIIGNTINNSGIYYYATKFQLNGMNHIYGGYSPMGGGFWNGTENVSGILTVVDHLIYYPVTLTVINNDPSITHVNIKGSFNEWTEVAIENSSGNVWTKTFDIPTGTFEWGVTNQNSEWLINGPNLMFSISSEGNITGQVEYIIDNNIQGTALVLERWIVLQENNNTSSITGNDLDGTNLGNLTNESQLIVKGGAIKTFKNGDYDIVGASLLYRCYKDSDVPGEFILIDMPWKENIDNNTQIWENQSITADILSDLDNGSYILEAYFEAYYKIENSSNILTITDNNAGDNYIATFTYDTGVGITNFDIQAQNIRYYPNPTCGNIYFDIPENIKNWNITIYNTLGQQMFNKNNILNIDVKKYPNGTYYLILSIDKQVIREKIIIIE